MKTAYYTVAEHIFSVVAQDDILAAMRNYEPFRTEAEEDSPSLLFRLRVDDGPGVKYIEETRQDEEGQVIVCGHTGLHEPVFEFIWDGRTAGWLVCTQDYREGTLHLSSHLVKAALDNALMVLFAMA